MQVGERTGATTCAGSIARMFRSWFLPSQLQAATDQSTDGWVWRPSDRFEQPTNALRMGLKDRWPVVAVSGVTLVNGLVGVWSVLAERFSERPELFNIPLPFGVYRWSRSLTLAFGFVLMFLSVHLLKRQKVAWWLALVGTVAAGITHLGRGHPWYAVLGSAVTIVLLLAFRRRYTVRSEPRSIARGLGLMLTSVLGAVA